MAFLEKEIAFRNFQQQKMEEAAHTGSEFSSNAVKGIQAAQVRIEAMLNFLHTADFMLTTLKEKTQEMLKMDIEQHCHYQFLRKQDKKQAMQIAQLKTDNAFLRQENEALLSLLEDKINQYRNVLIIV